MVDWAQMPENHPVKRLFRSLADRALTQSSLPDKDLLLYLRNLLVNFIYVENLYRLRGEKGKPLVYLIDMLKKAGEIPKSQRKIVYRHIGDFSLFILGMFPESLNRARRNIPRSYYAETGHRSYMVASELEKNLDTTVVFKKLADKFERCVLCLNWIREYTTDPFYQYMLHQFQVI